MGSTNETHKDSVVTETQNSLAPIALEFQPDAIEIEERPVPKAARYTLYALIALIICAILWATFSRVDRIVSTQGKLVTSDPLMLLQPLETSIIRDIHVEVGDNVSAGDVLVTLDPTFTTADVSQVQARLKSLQAEIYRLEAEYAFETQLFPGDNDLSLEEELQRSLFQARQIEYSARIENFRDRLATVEASLDTNQKEREGLAERDNVLKQIEEIFGELQDRQAGSKLRYLEAYERRLLVKNNLESIKSKTEELRRQAQSLRAEQEAFIEQWRREIIENLVKSRREFAQLQQELSKAERRSNLVVIKAPKDGVVLEIAQRSVGSVAKAAEPLVTLVPSEAILEAEIEINPSNIGYIKEGQEVQIKLSAFPFQRHGSLVGRLKTITENTVQGQGPNVDESGQPVPGGGQKQVYRSRVEIVDKELRNLPDHFRLIPGMTLTGEIKIGDRNVMAYFLHPFLKGLDESIKEP